MGKKKDDAPAGGEQKLEAGLAEAEYDPATERLVQIAEAAQFESGTLLGDLVEGMLELFKNRQKPWTAMLEHEQRDAVTVLQNAGREFLRKAVLVIAEADLPNVHVKMAGFSSKDGAIKGSFSANGDTETVTKLFALDGHNVTIISADARPFLGKKREPEISHDQPGLEFPDEPNHPEDDSDLAGEESTAGDKEDDQADQAKAE